MLTQKYKIRSQGAWPRSREPLLNFGTPLLSLVRIKLQMPKFAGALGVRIVNKKIKNWAKKGAWPRSRDLLLNFGTTLLSLVRMKLQMPNFAGALG